MDYGQILKNSWKVTFKNKWLWVYGLTLAAFEGGGSLNIPNLPSGSSDKLKNLPETSREVLGATTSFLSDWLSRVPVSTWILLAVGVFALILFGLIISLVVRSWAKGSLIAGMQQAHSDQAPDLTTTSLAGIASLKRLLIYGSLSFGLLLAFILVLVIVTGIMFALNIVLGGVVMFLSLIATLVSLVLFALLGVYAERLIVFNNYSPWSALKSGLTLAQKNFWPTLSMGLINNVIGCTGGCLVNLIVLTILGIPAIFLLYPLFKEPSQIPGVGSWVAVVVLFLLFILANTLLRAFFVVFNYSNWHQFYLSITKPHD